MDDGKSLYYCKDIEEQNQILEKIIAAYTERNIQKKELIFLLTQLKNMQD